MSKFLEAAKQILNIKKAPLHYREITAIAIEEGLIETNGVTPEATMNTVLARDVKKKGMASDFVKVGNAMYSLNENKFDSSFF